MSKTLEQINKFLDNKDNKKYHFNSFNEKEYKISSGSLNLDLALGGGLPAGAHRFTGINEGGKTSCALTFHRFAGRILAASDGWRRRKSRR